MAEMKLIFHTVERLVSGPRSENTPWGVERIGAPYQWEKGQGGGQVIAILDTGVDLSHPDLQDRIIDGRNFTTDYAGDRANYSDNHYHGTHVAGSAAAALNDAGVVGVAPSIMLLIGKVLTGRGSGLDQWVTEAIRWATTWEGQQGERVRVISMSLGGPEDNQDLHQAIKEAVNAGILVVCAAGNDGPGNAEYPGSYPEVVEVGATDQENRIANFSNTNPEIDLVAPGVRILSTYPGGKYAELSGTSMSTPHVSAAAALVIQEEEAAYQRTLTEPEVFALLIKRAKDLGLPKTEQGAGLLHLANPPQPTPEKHYYDVSVDRELSRYRFGYAVHAGFYRRKDQAQEQAQKLTEDLVKAGAEVNVSR